MRRENAPLANAGPVCYNPPLSMERKHIVKRLARMGVLFIILLAGLGGCFTQPFTGRHMTSSATVDADRLKQHVVVLSETFYPRAFENTNNLRACSDYILDHFRRAGARASFQEYPVMGIPTRNVLGSFGTGTNGRVVVGAHYDACSGTPGADDNASGVAALVELAYLLGKDPPRTGGVDLVAYCTEEPPFFDTDDMGSAVHARSLRDQGVAVKAMISLEMIGYFSDDRGSQKFPLPLFYLLYPHRGNFIAVVGRFADTRLIRTVKGGMLGATDLPVCALAAPTWVPGLDYSDHRNYWKRGYPAVMITDTAFYRNLAYHTRKDTADRLDYTRMSKVVVAVYEAVKSME